MNCECVLWARARVSCWQYSWLSIRAHLFANTKSINQIVYGCTWLVDICEHKLKVLYAAHSHPATKKFSFARALPKPTKARVNEMNVQVFSPFVHTFKYVEKTHKPNPHLIEYRQTLRYSLSMAKAITETHRNELLSKLAFRSKWEIYDKLWLK